MDFDPHGAKWQCCCCVLPSGLKILAATEVVACTVIAGLTVSNIVATSQISYFGFCLLAVSVLMGVASILLFVGIHAHNSKLMYPSIGARGLMIIFFTVFCGSVIASPPAETVVETATMTIDDGGRWNKRTSTDGPSENIALRLVALVFSMLFFAVLVLYTIYLIIRCISYEKSFARLKERRASLIHAGMIDPDFSDCRRTSNC